MALNAGIAFMVGVAATRKRVGVRAFKTVFEESCRPRALVFDTMHVAKAWNAGKGRPTLLKVG